MRNFIQNNRGMTLMETLVSVFIVSVAIAGMITLFVQAIEVSKRVELEYTAVNIAKNRIERARRVIATMGFDMLSSLVETDTAVNAEGIASPSGLYQRTTDITTNLGGDIRLTQIQVTIVYQFKKVWKVNATSVLSTIFANVE